MFEDPHPQLRLDRKPGERLNKFETKSNILKYIINNKNQVSEPDIRKYLYEILGTKDQGSINRHLKTLSNDLNCITMIKPIKKGLKNHWDICDINNLKNISFYFSEIDLNKYEKTIDIIIDTLFISELWSISKNDYINIGKLITESNMFFKICLDTEKIIFEKKIIPILISDFNKLYQNFIFIDDILSL